LATHGLWQSLPERVGKLEATIESLIRENERLRTQVANAHEAEEILRRAQAPPPGVPRPRSGHRRKRDQGITYLRIVRFAAPAAALALSAVLAGVIPVVRADDVPVRAAAVTPHALCDPEGFAPPSQDGIWRLMMAPHPGRVPCIEQPPAFTGG
jgi:hypothetical protein